MLELSSQSADCTLTGKFQHMVDSEQKIVPPLPVAPLSDADKLMQDRLTKLHTILGGDTTISLHLQFLIRANKNWQPMQFVQKTILIVKRGENNKT